MLNESLLAFGLGYLLGILFFAGLGWMLFRYSRKTLKQPPGWILVVGQWGVMPILLAIACFVAFGTFDKNTWMAMAGYVVSRLVRYLKIQRGKAMSNEDLLKTIHVNAIASTPEGERAIKEVLSRRK